MRLGLKNNFCIFTYTILFVFLSFISLSNISADTGVPGTLSYTGKLTDNGGNPLGGGGTTYYFKFSLWDSPTPGTGNKLWPTSSPNSIDLSVKQGSFSVDIGDTDNGYPDVLDYNFNTNSKIYLQVEVSGDNNTFETLAPRSSISSSAFSQVANSVNGIADSSFGTTTPFLNTLISALSTNINKAVMTIKGAVGQVANLFNIKDSSDNSLFIVTADGKVGVGTSTPGARLSVASGQISVDGGSALLPGYTFNQDTGLNTGIWRVSEDTIGFTAGGTSRFSISPSGMTSSVGFYGINGSVSSPSYTFSSDINTGLYSIGADNLGIATGGTLRASYNASGFAFIGTTNQLGGLTVSSANMTGSTDLTPTIAAGRAVTGGNALGASFRNFTGTTGGSMIEIAGLNSGNVRGAQLKTDSDGNFGIFTGSTAYSTLGTERFTVLQGGNVGVGTTTPAYLLDVVYNNSSAGALGAAIRTKNFNSTGSAEFRAENSLGYSARMFKLGSTYAGHKNLSANDIGFYNDSNAGNISILNDYVSGNINFAAGGASVAQFTLLPSGNIGIGTTTPTEKLDVVGNIKLTDTLKSYGIVNTSNYSEIFSTTDTTNGTIDALYIVPPMNQSRIFFGKSGKTAYSLNFTNVSAFENVPSNLSLVASTIDGLNASRISSAGTYLMLEAPAGSGNGYVSSRDSATLSRNSLAFIFHANNTDTYKRDAGFIFSSKESSANWTSAHTIWTNTVEAMRLMTLDNNGNLGIGTSTPGAKLDVWGNLRIGTSSTPALFVNTATGNIGAGTTNPTSSFGRTLNISGVGSAAITLDNGGAKKYSFGVTGTNSLGFYDETLSAYRLSIDSTGNIGIGTTTPTSKLSVAGDIDLTGALKLNSNAGTSGYLLQTTGTGVQWVATSSLGISASVNTLATASIFVGKDNTGGGAYGSSLGYSNHSQGNYSTAVGFDNTASSQYSVAMGYLNTASTNNYSVAVGSSNTSSGDASLAFGWGNTSSGSNSSVFGRSITNSIANSTMIGPSNTAKITIISTGNVGIGTTTPIEKLSVIGNAQFTAVGTGVNAFDLGITSDGTLTTTASDINLKENILLISSTSTLEKIALLKPSSFDWKSNSSHDIGLIAQEVELIFPELVFTNPTDGYKGINYSRFITLLISAVQEVSRKITGIMDGTLDVFAKTLRAKEQICIEDVCVTKQQLQQMLQNQNITTSVYSEPVVENGTTTEEVIPISDPVVENGTTTETTAEEMIPIPEPVVETPEIVPEVIVETPVE